MRNKRLDQKGFGAVEVIIVIIVLGLVGLISWRILGAKKEVTNDQTSTESMPQNEQQASMELLWQQGESGWRAIQTPPECPNQPIMKSPVDLGKVTAILYPGQMRGGNYKPHGGFRLDGTANDKVTVIAPIDGFMVRGGSYLAEGEVQYTFDIMNNCGVMYRVGHFRALPEKLQKIADTWPAPQEGDSRTQMVNPPLYISQGEVLATSVGIVTDKNTFFDWGVYDYRQPNKASTSASFQQAHAQDKELSWYAVCWFDWLPATDTAKVKSLPPGDPASGKKSDYCSVE